MTKNIFHLSIFILFVFFASCDKDDLYSKNQRLLTIKWNCIDYADSVDNVFKGRTPSFISNIYEHGYELNNDNTFWPRYKELNTDKFETDKRVKGKWKLSDDGLYISLIFDETQIEVYEILEISRKSLSLKGVEGIWAGNEATYIFEKN